MPDGPFEVLLKGARLFVGAEDLAEHEQNAGETVGEGWCRRVSLNRHALILHRGDGVRKARKRGGLILLAGVGQGGGAKN